MPAYLAKTALYIARGSFVTIELWALTMLCALPLAVLLALIRVAKGHRAAKRILEIYSWIFRGTPLLLQVFFAYYGLSLIGISLPPFAAAALTFVINYAAYLMEIFRAGIESIDPGQFEAALALNMSPSLAMRRIILPQALRRVLPPLSNEAINLVKDTALISVIGMADLLRAAQETAARDFSATAYCIAAILYLAMSSLLVLLFRRLEQKAARHE